MKILALNCGSSSVKYQLYDWTNQVVMAKGVVERIGLDHSLIVHENSQTNEKHKIEYACNNHEIALSLILKVLAKGDLAVIKDLKEISAIGHRVVHGGENFVKSELITDQVLEAIKAVSHLAPLHNPANLIGIKAAQKILPDVPQVVIFDTAFHQTMPPKAYIYPVPYNWYHDHAIRRYGFHGTSHLYVSKRAAVNLGKKAANCNIITAHIGNGASMCAIRNGISVDTSMGLTPLEGIVMGTRSGNIDPAIPLIMQEKLGVTPQEMDGILNKQCGVLGITTKYADRRDIEDGAAANDKLCELAIEIEAYYLRKYIGSYMAVLGHTDALVFTGGVGENSPLLRDKCLEGLEEMGIILDSAKNEYAFRNPEEIEISTPASRIKVYVIPTNEEQVFIEDVAAILEHKYTDHTKYAYSFLK